jgi:hypothetical protein
MTRGELIWLRAFREVWDLPTEVIKMIIRSMSIRGQLAWRLRRAMPTFSHMRFQDPHLRLRYLGMQDLPFYGPGY